MQNDAGTYSKSKLYLFLCVLGIAAAALIAWVLGSPGTSRSIAAGNNLPAVQKLALSGAATDQQGINTAITNQDRSGGPSITLPNSTSVSAQQASSAVLQGLQTDSPPSNPPVSLPPAQTAAPSPDVLYPVDPIPCKQFSPYTTGCGGCESYPSPDSPSGSCQPWCRRGGVQMMCASPL